MAWLDDSYRIERLYVDSEGADQVVRIVVGLAHCVFVGGATRCADPGAVANASTLLGHITLPAVLLLAAAMAWPARSAAEYPLRLALLTPALMFTWAVDVPMVLWASLWGLHVQAFEPQRISPLLSWAHFMESGGRVVLPLVLAALVSHHGERLLSARLLQRA